MSKDFVDLQPEEMSRLGMSIVSEGEMKAEEAKQMIYQGFSNSIIAEQLGISESEIERMKNEIK